MDKKGSFILYTRYAEFSADLSDEDFGRLMRAVFAYEEFKTMPENLSPMAMVLFRVIKSDLDMNAQKYAETVEKRREAGKKGGRPKKEEDTEGETENQTKAKKANGFLENQTKAKKADNVDEDDNDDEDEYEGDYVDEDEDDNEYVPSSASAAHKAYEELIGEVTPRVVEILGGYELSEELKVVAIEEAHDNNKKSISYIKAILDRFVKAKILTIEDWERSKAKRKGGQGHSYDFDDIEQKALEKRLGKKGGNVLL